MQNRVVLICICFSMFLLNCTKIDREVKVDRSKLLASDYRIYQDTPVWDLAKAVWDNDPKKVEQEVKKNPKILNYQDPLYGKTLLHLSIYNGQYKAFKELLKLGANPNVYDSLHCTSPIIQACKYDEDRTKYVEGLIQYGANVNDVECLTGKEEQKTNRTALMYASNVGNLKLVKLLIKNGAKVNYVNKNGEFALFSAISRNYDVVLYLLEQGARCDIPFYPKYENGKETGEYIYIKDIISSGGLIHASKQYNKIVEILKKRGCITEFPADYPK